MTKLASLRATITGNILEWLDWTLYATFSPYIAKALFAPTDSVSALLQTLAVFAVGFLARPLGSIVLSRVADKRGRSLSLVISMSLMAWGSLLLALTPSYAQIGVWASVWLLAARLLQGFAHGGETASAFVYISEIAPQRSRGLWVSTIFASSTFGVILGSLMGVALTKTLDTTAVAEWGWRVPFVIGAFLGVYAYYLRRGLVETVEPGHQRAMPALSAAERRQAFMNCFKLFLLVGATGIPYYTWLSFATSFAISNKGIAPSDAFLASLGAQVLCMLSLPFYGALSDRIGRKPLAVFTTLGFTLLAFPLDIWFTNSAWALFFVQSVALVLWASIGSVYPALMSEQFRSKNRALGIGAAYSSATVVFAGTAPYINAWLTAKDVHWAFTTYSAVMTGVATIAVLTLRETKGISLESTGESH